MNAHAIDAVTTILAGEGSLALGTPVTCGALGVCPLHRTSASSLEYLTYEEALRKSAVETCEVGDAGAVPELLLDNNGDEMVLVIDGQQLIGAKQNRVLNTTVLVASRSKVVIPVSCVEAGRWHFESGRRNMGDSGCNLYAMTRARKNLDVTRSLETVGYYHADQQEIWRDIDARLSGNNVSAPTQAMHVHFESQSGALGRYMEDLALDRFERHDTMVGAVFTLCGEVMGFDAFDKPETLGKQWEKLLSSYAIEALRQDGDGSVDPAVVRSFLDEAAAAQMAVFEPPGLGADVRISGESIAGSALAVDGEIAHVYAFSITPDDSDSEGQPSMRTTRMASYSDRAARQRRGKRGPRAT